MTGFSGKCRIYKNGDLVGLFKGKNMKNLLNDKRFFVFKAGILSLTVIVLVLLCVFSCNNLLVLSSGGALIVSVPGGRAISDATIYTIELKGTNGSVYSKTVNAGQVAAFEELVPDTYSILVKGSNVEDIVVYYGSATAIVEAGKTASAMVELMSLLGGLNVEFSGNAATSNGKSFLVDLRGSSGSLYTKTVPAGETAQFERLVPDLYTIDVHGTNANNAVLYHGINTATVEVGKKTSTTVDLVVEASDFASLKEAIQSGGTVYVVNDIAITESFTVKEDVVIQALDKDVTLTYTGSGILFTVQESANLRIGGGEYMLTLNGNGQTRASPLLQIASGTVDLYGTITNSTNNDSAAGIKVNGANSTLNMYDGAIVSNCRCSNTWGIGGAIGLESGNMNMYGGSITGNSAQDASAVYVNNNSVFTMSGGTISGNSNDIAINVSSSTFQIGGGALISSDDKVSLKNSPAITIISPLTGGDSVATLTLKDGFSSGDAVLIAGDSVDIATEFGKFALSSGTIKADGTLQ